MIHDQDFVQEANNAVCEQPSNYHIAITMIEKLDKKLLEVIGNELDRRGYRQVNATQAQLMHKIGNKRLRHSDLHNKGYYLGSNVSYNLKKLAKLGLVSQETGLTDKRTSEIALTEEGQKIAALVEALYQRQLEFLEKAAGINQQQFSQLNDTLRRLDRYWTDQVLYQM